MRLLNHVRTNARAHRHAPTQDACDSTARPCTRRRGPSLRHALVSTGVATIAVLAAAPAFAEGEVAVGTVPAGVSAAAATAAPVAPVAPLAIDQAPAAPAVASPAAAAAPVAPVALAARPRAVAVSRAAVRPRVVIPARVLRLNWTALARCESGNRPTAVNRRGRYYGLFQFNVRTWRAVGGAGYPHRAPRAEQTLRAQKLFLSRGSRPWPVCGRRLYR